MREGVLLSPVQNELLIRKKHEALKEFAKLRAFRSFVSYVFSGLT